jgi:hypothetical protein
LIAAQGWPERVSLTLFGLGDQPRRRLTPRSALVEEPTAPLICLEGWHGGCQEHRFLPVELMPDGDLPSGPIREPHTRLRHACREATQRATGRHQPSHPDRPLAPHQRLLRPSDMPHPKPISPHIITRPAPTRARLRSERTPLRLRRGGSDHAGVLWTAGGSRPRTAYLNRRIQGQGDGQRRTASAYS